jgi:hypothetical protein
MADNSLIPTGDVSVDLPEWREAAPSLFTGFFPTEWKRHFEATAAGVTAGEHEAPSLQELLSPPLTVYRPRGMPTLLTAEEVEGELGFTLPVEVEQVLAISTRQGGGNRECYCETPDESHEDGCLALNNEELQAHPQYLHDEDDEWDRTYATFYFKVTAPRAWVREFKERELRATLLRLRLDEFKRIKTGEIAPWSIRLEQPLADETRQLRALKSNLDRTSLATLEARKEELQLLLQKFYTGTFTVEDAGNVKLSQMWAHHHRSMAEASRSYVAAKQTLAAAQTMLREAENLPPGPLKEYLLGDRGTFTYKAKEKRGRRNVEVPRTVQRETRLEDELKSAERGVTNSERSFHEWAGKLTEAIQGATEAVTTHRVNQKLAEELEQKLWTAGWPGEGDMLPPRPETVKPDVADDPWDL